MALSAPVYAIGDAVYIKESAALGFLEAYAIESIRYAQDGTIIYKLVSSLRPPTAVQSYGDRFTGQRLLPVEFFESDLVTLCEALDLSILSLNRQLSNLELLRVQHGCIEEGTEEGTG